LGSCTKEDVAVKNDTSAEDQPVPVNDYLQLTLGNTWTYEAYQLDNRSGEITYFSKQDRLQVTKDSMIAGRAYYCIEGSRIGADLQLLLRLSGPEAIDAYDRLYFATNQIGEPYELSKNLLPDGVASSNAVVEMGPQVSTPYGTYPTLVLKQELQLSPEFGGDSSSEVDRIDRAYYAEGVGLLQYTQYYPVQGLELGMRLVGASLE
jgi:hypothetical protein